MINTIKHYEFFDAISLSDQVHVIGCGAIGSNLAIQLAHLGVNNINLYDFDIVNEHNIANQAFRNIDIDKPKVEALNQMLHDIDPDIVTTIHPDGYKDQTLSGYVFLCVDSIELRKQIVKDNQTNMKILYMFDFRMRLSDAQHYSANWKNLKQKEEFYESMNFSEEEAKEATPLSACGTTLSVLPTVCMIVSLGVANFIKAVKREDTKRMVEIDAFIPGIQSI